VGKFVRRRRGGIVAAALVLLALTWGVIVSTWQAREAARERDLAVAVSTFLEELFEAPDPRTGLVRDTTRMVDFLAVAEDRVRDGLPDQPRPRARLQLTLGTVYRNLARPDRAIPVLREAVESHDEAYGGEHPDAVEARRLLGLSLAETGEFDAGVEQLEEALEAQIRLEGPDAARTARLHETLGRAFANAQRNDEALPWLERALEARRAQRPPDPVALSSSLNTLGSVMVQAGRVAEAAPLLEEAADVLTDAGDAIPSGVRQSDEGYSRNNLSQVLLSLNRRDEAAVQADRAWALLDSAFSGPNPAKATNMRRRATLMATDPALTPALADRADSLYRASLAMQAALPRDPGALMFGWNGYARSLRTWSRVLERPELLEEAIEAFRTSVVEGSRDFGADNPLVLSGRADIGKTLVEAGRPRDGLAETQAAFPVIVEVMPPQHPMVANAAIAHATALTANGRGAEAMEVIAGTRGPLAEALSEEHPLIQAMDEAYEEARAAR
jgi:tetratricopeptide (TPR) repeat protein